MSQPVVDSGPRREIRTDIQALRGFAVLIVLLFHAGFGIFSAGYLGVDVFFVISGFLITRLVKDALESGTFSFRKFYFRRAKRLLPAAYATFLVTALLAPFLLTSAELADFRAQFLGAITFTSNFVLWGQSGYFAGAADLKPFLHVWSLSLEEQYYFLLPASLIFVPKRFWKPGAILVVISSFALCVLFTASPDASFYFLPTRAWELGLGSIGALTPLNRLLKECLTVALWPALAALCILPAVEFSFHPGPQALLVCTATLIVILRNSQPLSASAPARALGKFGDMSYSLYLVHWPLFAYLNNTWIGPDDGAAIAALRIGVALASIACGAALYYGIERPLHRADLQPSRRTLCWILAASGLVASAGIFATAPPRAAKEYANARAPNYGLAQACGFDGRFKPIPACRNSDAPEMLVWGDSYAMHLLPGLAGADAVPPAVVQATETACGPLLGLAVFRGGAKYDPVWTRNCINFNDSVVEYLRGASSIRTVVLSSPFNYYLQHGGVLLERDERDQSFHRIRTALEPSVAAMKRTIDVIRSLGRKVVVIAPPPTEGIDMSRCNERIERGLPVLGADHGCRIRVDRYRTGNIILPFLNALPRRAGVDVIYFDDYLCDSNYCKTRIGDTFLYRDAGHLSPQGSVALAKAVSLVERIRATAR